MKYLLSLLWISLFTMLACSQQEVTEDEPLEPITFVQKETFTDTLQHENGVDAIHTGGPSDNNGIRLMWHSHPQAHEIEYYTIYRSNHPEGLSFYQQVAVKYPGGPNIADTVFIDDSDVDLNRKYFYYVTCTNEANVESVPSDTVWYTVIEKAQLIFPNSEAVIDSLPVWFQWARQDYPDQYILRIERFITETFHPLVYIKLIQSKYESPQTELVNDWKPTAQDNGMYRWRIDCVGRNKLYEGSESIWRTFTLNLK
ncbi:MAG: hypothetical protein GF313_09425 [Caldithrix sp.]|nr:hypothetical protein [Caldithrix sp.]